VTPAEVARLYALIAIVLLGVAFGASLIWSVIT
jgi:hypothetical protein